jgi:hypothetical protein
VQTYLDKHDLTKKVEEAINATVKAKPDEPAAFLVRTPPDALQVSPLVLQQGSARSTLAFSCICFAICSQLQTAKNPQELSPFLELRYSGLRLLIMSAR